jgi:hypothetical protein
MVNTRSVADYTVDVSETILKGIIVITAAGGNDTRAVAGGNDTKAVAGGNDTRAVAGGNDKRAAAGGNDTRAVVDYTVEVSETAASVQNGINGIAVVGGVVIVEVEVFKMQFATAAFNRFFADVTTAAVAIVILRRCRHRLKRSLRS